MYLVRPKVAVKYLLLTLDTDDEAIQEQTQLLMTVSYTADSLRIGSFTEAEPAFLHHDDDITSEPRQELATLNMERVSVASDKISVAPGIGYHYGTLVEWAGERVIAGLVLLDIHRRMWLIRRLIGRICRTVDVSDRSVFLHQREGDLHRASRDLLELST